MLIYGKKVCLRAIEEEDLPQLHEWANDPEIWYLLGGWHFPTNKSSQAAWFKGISSPSQQHLRLAVTTPEQGLIGTTNLVDINWKDKNAFTGAMIGSKDIRGLGLGTDTVMTLMRYAFEELGLNRLDTTIISYNQPSYHVYTKKCGWVEEGVQRNWYFRKNQYWDRYVMGITRDDYFSQLEKTRYWDV